MFLEYAKNKVWLPVPDFKIFTRQDINYYPQYLRISSVFKQSFTYKVPYLCSWNDVFQLA